MVKDVLSWLKGDFDSLLFDLFAEPRLNLLEAKLFLRSPSVQSLFLIFELSTGLLGAYLSKVDIQSKFG